MKIHFEVTEEDIASGVRASSNSCPIARCISRTMEHGDRWPYSVDVEVERLSFNCKGDTVAWNRDVPEKMRSFIEHFDNGHPVKPFKFSVTIKGLPDPPTPDETNRADRTS